LHEGQSSTEFAVTRGLPQSAKLKVRRENKYSEDSGGIGCVEVPLNQFPENMKIC
jgi:hypothetical protein